MGRLLILLRCRCWLRRPWRRHIHVDCRRQISAGGPLLSLARRRLRNADELCGVRLVLGWLQVSKRDRRLFLSPGYLGHSCIAVSVVWWIEILFNF